MAPVRLLVVALSLLASASSLAQSSVPLDEAPPFGNIRWGQPLDVARDSAVAAGWSWIERAPTYYVFEAESQEGRTLLLFTHAAPSVGVQKAVLYVIGDSTSATALEIQAGLKEELERDYGRPTGVPESEPIACSDDDWSLMWFWGLRLLLSIDEDCDVELSAEGPRLGDAIREWEGAE